MLALLVRAFFLQAFKIPSSSMVDTLLIGDHLIVSKFSYGLQVPRPAFIRVFGVWVPFFETQLKPYWGTVRRGDIVVFRWPGSRDMERRDGSVVFHRAYDEKEARATDFIKRVVALPGDRISVSGKEIFINGVRLDDPYGNYWGACHDPRCENFGPYTVPEGHVFVMGDNRNNSNDSRYWGPVPINDIKGKAFIIYLSWDKDASWVRFDRIGNIIR